MKIHRINVDLDTRCPVCNMQDEDWGHVFLKCKAAKACWNIVGMGNLWDKLSLCTSSRDLLTELWKCDDDTNLCAATFMWEWWNIRNKVNAGESITDPRVVRSKVERLPVDFLYFKKPVKPPKSPDIHKRAKPPDNHVKVNFDGSYLAGAGMGGWGYVIRNQAGKFIAAGSGKSSHLGSDLESEVVAHLAAIQGANEIGANRSIFESDRVYSGTSPEEQ
jgi:hypothetical protein